MADILAKICNDKRKYVWAQRLKVPEEELLPLLDDIEPPRGFHDALKRRVRNRKVGLIAEIKKASPSKGIIRENFDPAALAKAYRDGGATCLSVLTDEPYFQGKDAYLQQARDACMLPVLRKDFMLDEYQVTEARALGADCILLIMAALDDQTAMRLEGRAFQLGMDVLIEVHDEIELERALRMSSRLIGINNRNLKTMQVSLKTTEKLAAQIPAGYTVVCESGIQTHANIEQMHQSGVFCFLVGESLMRQEDVAEATRTLLNKT